MNKFAYGIFTLTLSQLVFAQDEPQDLGIMNIVGTSPIGGNIDADKLPTNVQTVSARAWWKFFSLSQKNSAF